ncbi:MAG: hypothetical protein AAGL17_18670 [Cyanobacteria bacterium J06576_12]
MDEGYQIPFPLNRHDDGSGIGSSPSLVSSPRAIDSLESQVVGPFHPALRIDAQSLPQG